MVTTGADCPHTLNPHSPESCQLWTTAHPPWYRIYPSPSLQPHLPSWTRTTRTPAFWGYPQPPHAYPHYWVILDPKSKEDNVKVTNLKNWLKFLLKIQSGPDLVRRRMDRRTDGWTTWNQYTLFQLRWSGGYNNYNVWLTDSPLDKMVTKLLRVILSAIWSVKIS